MKVIELRAENFKRLQAIEIRPDGDVVQVTGRNAQGKSSVLDALWAAFAGKAACPTVPIRTGAEQARIRVDCGELVITRTFKHAKDGDYTTTITVENADGARYPSAQAVLDGLMGSLTFDPLAFARVDARAQFDALKRFVPDIDFEQITNLDRGDRDRRTELGRFARQERAAASVIVTPPDTPEEEIDESALVAELEDAGAQNADLEQRKANRERLRGEADGQQRRAEQLKARAAELREEANKVEAAAAESLKRAQDIDKKLDEAPELQAPADTSAIRQRIEDARTVNGNVRKLTDRLKHTARAVELEKQIESITAKIEQRQKDKDAAIAAAKMPVEALGFGDGVVLLNGLPFAQASDAEQLRVSVAIAMAAEPKLRVIRIRDGSLLDDQAMELLAQMAAANNFQVWIEKVDSTGKVGFVLEDGQVRKSAPTQRKAETEAAA